MSDLTRRARSSLARAQVACRTNTVHLIKNGEVAPTAIELETAPCGLAQTSKLVIVACMNRAVHAFHTRGKKAYSLYMPAPVVVMELVSVQRARLVKALIVALGSGEARARAAGGWAAPYHGCSVFLFTATVLAPGQRERAARAIALNAAA